jgi:hypothetical protein
MSILDRLSRAIPLADNSDLLQCCRNEIVRLEIKSDRLVMKNSDLTTELERLSHLVSEADRESIERVLSQ